MISYLTKLSFNHKLRGSLGAEVRLFRLAEQLLAAVHLLRLLQVKLPMVKHRERIDDHPEAEVQSGWKKAAGITSFGNKRV